MQPMPADLGIAPPPRQSLAQTVAFQLRDLIDSGKIEVGAKLPSESELKERFQVGRSTIREALNGLVLLGMIEVRHGQGAVVIAKSRDGESLEAALRSGVDAHLLEARWAVETTVAEIAAERATPDDLKAMEDLLKEAREIVAAGQAAVEASVGFHKLLAESTGNPFFVNFIDVIHGLLRERGELLQPAAGYAEWEIEMHQDLLDAVASGDPKRARLEMERHLGDMKVILLEGWEALMARSSEADRGDSEEA